MYEMLGAEGFLRNQEKGVIEVAPLAYMRGRTLDNAFIILDEAQNTTPGTDENVSNPDWIWFPGGGDRGYYAD